MAFAVRQHESATGALIQDVFERNAAVAFPLLPCPWKRSCLILESPARTDAIVFSLDQRQPSGLHPCSLISGVCSSAPYQLGPPLPNFFHFALLSLHACQAAWPAHPLWPLFVSTESTQPCVGWCAGLSVLSSVTPLPGVHGAQVPGSVWCPDCDVSCVPTSLRGQACAQLFYCVIGDWGWAGILDLLGTPPRCVSPTPPDCSR